MPVNGVLEYLWYRDNDPWWATLLRTVALIALVVLFVIKGMHKVPSGSKALRTRFNKVVHYRRDFYDRLGYTIRHRGEAKVVGPGLVIGIPFVHNVMVESITEQFEPLPDGVEVWNTKYDGQYAPRPGTFELLGRLKTRRPDVRAFYGLDLHVWLAFGLVVQSSRRRAFLP